MIAKTIYGIRVALLLLVSYWLLLFIATHIPRVPMPGFSNSDKFIHFGAFFGLAFLLAWAIPTYAERRWMNVALSFGIVLTYAALDEVTQAPVGRTPDIADWIADSSGAFVGLIAYTIIRAYLTRPNRFSKSRGIKPDTIPTAKQPSSLESPVA